MNIITNAFSINMLTGQAKVTFTPIAIEEVLKHLDAFEYVSAIGHAETAAVVSSLLGQKVPMNRMTVKLPVEKYGSSHSLIVAQYNGPRLPEGATTLPDGATIEFWSVFIE